MSDEDHFLIEHLGSLSWEQLRDLAEHFQEVAHIRMTMNQTLLDKAAETKSFEEVQGLLAVWAGHNNDVTKASFTEVQKVLSGAGDHSPRVN